MDNTQNTQFYTLGRGKIYVDLFKPGTNTGTGERYLGNTPEVGLTTETDVLDHFNSDSGIREKDLTILLESSRGGSFATDVISKENVAMFFMGEVSDATMMEMPDQREAFKSWARGRTLQLGTTESTPTGARNITNLVIGTADASLTLDLSGDIASNPNITVIPLAGNATADLALGRLYLEPTSSELTANKQIVVQYDVEAQTRSLVLSKNEMLYGSLRYIADNPVGENRDMFFPKVALTPDGDYNLKGDDWQTMGFTFSALKLGGQRLVYVDIRESANDQGQVPSDMRTVNVVAAATSGPANTPIGYTITVRDGNNNVVAGEAVTITATNGGVISDASENTGLNGKVAGTVNLAAAGTTTVTATVTTAAGPVSGSSQPITFS